MVPHLNPYLKSRDKDLRHLAVGTIGYFVPTLEDFNDIAANDPDEEIRKLALEILGGSW